MRREGSLTALALLCWCGAAISAAPAVLNTSGYQAPVRADPDDLLLIAGAGFTDTDRVVYRAVDPNVSAAHPAEVPDENTASEGIAPVVQIGDPAYALTVRLPDVMRARATYRLWVVTAGGEWSAPVLINDPRPMWLTPGVIYANRDPARLGRRLRVIGRNLDPEAGQKVRLRLEGPETIVLDSTLTGPMQHYLAEAELPRPLPPGRYAVSVSRGNMPWLRVPEQELEVVADPSEPAPFNLTDPAYGACVPDDDNDDSDCLNRAINAAREAGGGAITLGPGTWYLSSTRAPGGAKRDGFVLPPNVDLRGIGARWTHVVRRGARDAGDSGPLLSATGRNSITGLTFSDADPFASPAEAWRPTIQLGQVWTRAAPTATVDDVVISGNVFRRVGRGITSGGLPIRRMFITRNDIGAWHTGIVLNGDRSNTTQPFRIIDSVVRWNRFVPGSYTDITARQGTIATGLGAATRVDFSSNFADGASLAGLQDPADPPGFRAAFFWNLENNNEQLLIAENRIDCPGDKVGDGEAIGLDGNGATFGFKGAPAVDDAGADWISVKTPLLAQQRNRPVSATYYEGHWVQVVQGRGLGQTRRIVSYSETPDGVTLRVAPRWDVVPAAGTARVLVGRQFWQVYAVGNRVDQSSATCRKSNLTGPRGGSIVMWVTSSDSVIGSNRQLSTSGIQFTQGFTVKTPSCPTCADGSTFQAALEVRNNVIDGEYDFGSDCSDSGIMGSFGASPTPEEPPPVGSFAPIITRNEITQADALAGGAIAVTPTWHRGPPPNTWPFVQNPLIFANTIRNVTGPLPRANCSHPHKARTGIKLAGPGSVTDGVLYRNVCERVDRPIDNESTHLVQLCGADVARHCGCPELPAPAQRAP